MYKYKAKDTYFRGYFDLKVIPPFQFPYFPLFPPLISKKIRQGVHVFIFQAILLIFCMQASIVLPLIKLLSKMGKKYPTLFPLFIVFLHPLFRNCSQHCSVRCLMYEYKAKETYFLHYFALTVIPPFQFPYFPLPPLTFNEGSW